MVVRRRVARKGPRDGVPDALEEAFNALDSTRLPGLHLLEGAHEHLVDAQSVGAIRPHDVVGVDDVASGLAHLLAVFAENDALVNEFGEWLGVANHTEIEKDLVPETCVEKV